MFCGIGAFHLRSSTVPNAHDTAAPRISSAAIGVRWKLRTSSPRSTAIPAMPSTMPATFRFDSGSCSSASANITLQIGIVKARIAVRPAGSCCRPNSTSPFQPVMLNKASTITLPQRCRGTRIGPPESPEIASMPSAENGSVSARNVSGAISDTPSFSTGQLQPQTSVSTSSGISAAAVMCV